MSGWITERADAYCDSVRDGTHDSPKPVERGHRLITSKHIANETLNFAGANFISDEDYEAINQRSKVDVGDLLFSMIGTVGRVYRVDDEPDYAIKNMGLFKISDELKSKYLFYYMQSPTARQYIEGCLAGSTQKFMSLTSLRAFPIVYPNDHTTMAAIVEILDSLTWKHRINQRTNDYLAAMCDAVFSEQFGGIEDNAVLSDAADITMGQSPSGKSYNEDGDGTVFYQGRGEFGWRFPTQRLFTTEPKRMAAEGDVLMSVRAPVGDLNVAYEDCCIGRGLAAIHSQYPSYCLYLMRSLGKKLDAYNGEGTVFGSINGKALNGLEIGLPDIDAIKAFETYARPIDQQIRSNVTEERCLAALRDALLPKLMSGEIDVSQVELPMQPNNHLSV